MSMNQTPSGERVHIGFFGLRNAGKSSVVNAVTGQELAVVSDTKGTTTDPVSKAMEILPLGPVMIIDTPGIDDEGALGELRVRRAKQVLNKTDVAVLVLDSAQPITPAVDELIDLFEKKEIPYIKVFNKSDLTEPVLSAPNEIAVCALTGAGIPQLREMLAHAVPAEDSRFRIVGDLLAPEDFAVLVVPIDSAAPKGRLILPQQQTIRDILEANAGSVVVKETQLKAALSRFRQDPAMVICDSQVFERVAAQTPADIPLTSFSILMARHKGFLETAVLGAAAIDRLQDGDTILISEGCTHHRQCDDIGTVKLPRWLGLRTRKQLNYEFSSGTGFPEDLSRYALVIHCGGCMLNAREMRYRMNCTRDAGVPFTNYGTAIAYMHGVLRRSLSVFPDIQALLP